MEKARFAALFHWTPSRNDEFEYLLFFSLQRKNVSQGAILWPAAPEPGPRTFSLACGAKARARPKPRARIFLPAALVTGFSRGFGLRREGLGQAPFLWPAALKRDPGLNALESFYLQC